MKYVWHFEKLCLIVSVQALPFCYFQQEGTLEKITHTKIPIFRVTLKYISYLFVFLVGI